MNKRSGISQSLIEAALPLGASPGTQAALMAAATGLIHGRRIAGKSIQRGRQIAQRIKMRKILRAKKSPAR